MPGDALYAVKTGAENVQMGLTFGDKGKASLSINLAERRIEEMASETRRGQETQELGSRVAHELDKAVDAMARAIDKADADDVKELSRHLAESSLRGQLTLDALTGSSEAANKESLKEALNVLRRSKLIADVSYENPSFLDTRPSVLDETLEDGQFKISGTLTKAEGTAWQIDGLTLNDVQYSGIMPPANKRVRTEGVTRSGRTYVVKVETDEDVSGEVSIEGAFHGTGDGGSVWYVGGIQVTVPKTITPPAEGDELRLRRPSESSNEGFSQMEARQDEKAGVEYEGRLSGVDVNARTITVGKAGTNIKVNVSQATIRTEEKRALTFSQLQASLGRDVEVRGLYSKNGVLYAGEVRVETGGHENEKGD